MANVQMTDGERQQRQAKLFVARDTYERLLEAYERDARAATDGGLTANDLLALSSPREDEASEGEFRRGYWNGTMEAIDHAWRFLDAGYTREAVYRVLADWHTGALYVWCVEGEHGHGDIAMPPSPMPPKRKKGGD
ncbi:MAG TPA: hypothetical protein VMV29_09780 [Ktedonobacterales bacterium]|nr:hypothetical protein [Ktedonobacterales bacterium]